MFCPIFSNGRWRPSFLFCSRVPATMGTPPSYGVLVFKFTIKMVLYSPPYLYFIKSLCSFNIGMPNCKNKSKWRHARIIVTQRWYDSTDISSVSQIAIFSNKVILTGIFLSFWHKFDQNPFMVIAILSISCFVIFQVTVDGGHLGIPN